MAVKRFATHSAIEIEQKLENVMPSCTKKANKLVENTFRDYLKKPGY